jgi:hypothetical protein
MTGEHRRGRVYIFVHIRIYGLGTVQQRYNKAEHIRGDRLLETGRDATH